MGKSKHKKKKTKEYQGPTPEQVIEKNLLELDKILAELKRIDEIPDAHPGPLWGDAHKLLLKAKANPSDTIQVITSRDLAALARIIAILRQNPEALRAAEENKIAEAEAAIAAIPPDIAPEILKNAMRAFRKRLKLTQLDHESRLGVGPMSGGKKADFDAIIAPTEFPPQVWHALAAQGRLRNTGQGFYELIDK